MYSYLDDYGDMVIDLEPDHRNGVRYVRRRANVQNARQLPMIRDARERIVIRQPPRNPPVVVQQPATTTTPELGVNVGGMRIPLTMIAGAVLTLGGLGVQLASNFVSQPDLPDRANAKIEDVADYEKEKASADRKVQLMESIGRALSDLGQLAAFRRAS